MGIFGFLKKKKVQIRDITTTDNIQPDKTWLDRSYMSGYDVGQIEGYTDLSDEPKSDEGGIENLLKWERYQNQIIVTGIREKKLHSIEIPETINGYVVRGIKRMAFMDCQIQSITIPDSVEYIGGMAVGFVSQCVFNDDGEREVRAMHPFVENQPTSTFMNKEFFLHSIPKTKIIGGRNAIAEKYALTHHLPYSVSDSEPVCLKIDSLSKDEAIHILRNNIISSITNTPAEKYELASLLWGDAARCFSTGSQWNWDGAFFKIDLSTGKLFAEVSTYPNQFGASREATYKLTALEFHEKAKEFHMSDELQCMATEEDWEELFDDELKEAVSNAKEILRKQREEEQMQNAVVIPSSFDGREPTMEFNEIELCLHQRYATNRVVLSQNANKYTIRYVYESRLSSDIHRHDRVLSNKEAIWLEQQVNACMESLDDTTRESMVGGDWLDVCIRRNGKICVEITGEKPLNKYKELSSLMEKLARFGSLQ